MSIIYNQTRRKIISVWENTRVNIYTTLYNLWPRMFSAIHIERGLRLSEHVITIHAEIHCNPFGRVVLTIRQCIGTVSRSYDKQKAYENVAKLKKKNI